MAFLRPQPRISPSQANPIQARLRLWVAAAALALGPFCGTLPAASASFQTTAGAESPGNREAALRQRVEAYYRAIQENKKGQAFQFVAPESQNDFFDMDYNTLVSIRITGVQFSPGRSTATVALVRSERVPMFQQVLDLPAKDTWKQVAGKWCLVLNLQSSDETPFGKMHFSKPPADSAQSGQAPQPMQKNVTPAEAMKALQKAEARAPAQPTTAPANGKTLAKPSSAKKAKDPNKDKPNDSTPHR